MKNKFRFSLASLIIGVAVLALLVSSAPLLAHAATLTRQLELGMSGSDVSTLQTFLKQDTTIYPQGLVTGYFGFLTKAAVSNFQSRNGIAAVGRVGPITLAAINLQMAGGIPSSDVYAPTISNVNVAINGGTANVSWNTNEAAAGKVYYSTSPLSTYERVSSVDVSGSIAQTDTSLRNSQNIFISNLQRNTTYYYLIYVTDQSGNVSVTWPTTFSTN